VASGVAWTCCIGRCHMYRFNASPWPSTWSAEEGHSFATVAYFAWHNRS
jgi:hypothetical protein